MSPPTLEAPTIAAAALEDLIGRFNPDDIDVPGDNARIRIEVVDGEDFDVVIEMPEARIERADGDADARLTADARTWARIGDDLAGGMDAFRRGRLRVRDNLHLGVGLLAATSGSTDPDRLSFGRIATAEHEIAYCEAGVGPPLVCLHGLGGTKASFLPTLAALAPEGNRVIAIDLPGFADSDKPHAAPFDAPWYADVVTGVLDAFELETASFAGADLSGARIIGELKEANLDGARLVGTDLGADPANQGMVPVRVDMSRATLNGADLTGANLVHVVLAFAKLRGAKLKDAKLGWANLSGAELEGADVSGADFTDADLDGASLAGIRGAETAKGLEEAK